MKECRTCGTKKPRTATNFTLSRLGGKSYWSKKCRKCQERLRRSIYKPGTKTLKRRHLTRTEEKQKALERDHYTCIYPGCIERRGLQFHHAFSTALDKPEKGTDLNRFELGVTLCDKHHKDIKTHYFWYKFCQYYLRTKHPEVSLYPPLTIDERAAYIAFIAQHEEGCPSEQKNSA